MAENEIFVAGALSRPIPEYAVIVGAGLGGVQALSHFLPSFPADFPGTIIVLQDTRPGFTSVVAERLAVLCNLPVEEVADDLALDRPRVLVARFGMSLSFAGRCSMGLGSSAVTVKETESIGKRADSTMMSAAQVFHERAIGVVLTGLGRDGVQGLASISDSGGLTFAQDESTSTAFDVPRAAIQAGAVLETVPLWDMAHRILDVTAGDNYAAIA